MAGTSPPEKKKLASTLVVDLPNPSPIHASPSHGECQSNGDEKNGHAKEVQTPKEAKPVETQALPNGKTRTTVTKTMSKRKMYQHKEKKATQMLAIVLGKVTMLSFYRSIPQPYAEHKLHKSPRLSSCPLNTSALFSLLQVFSLFAGCPFLLLTF